MDNLTLYIEKLAVEHKSYIDAIIAYCEKFEQDFEEILGVLNPIIINKVRQEYIDKNFIPNLKNNSSLKSFF